MTTPTPLPLDAAALDRIESGELGVGPSIGDRLIAQSRAALDLAARVAKLEAELAEDYALRTRMGDILTLTVNALKGEPDSRSLHDWATLPDVARSLVDHANALRDALDAIARKPGVDPQDVAERALAAHPAASLAAHDAEVLERAVWAAQEHVNRLAKIGPNLTARGLSAMAEAESIVATLRALAAQAQEVKK